MAKGVQAPYQTKRYFTTDDHANLIYFQFPKLLMYGERYKKMSADGKLFYMLCLDLIKLSMKKGWKDEYGRYYIKMSLEIIQKRMSCAKQKAANLKKELADYELMDAVRIGQGKADRLYILQVEYSDEDIYIANNDHEDIENDEFQSSESSSESSESGSESFGTLEPHEKYENRTSRSTEIVPLEVRKSSPIKNLSIKTNSIKQDKEDDDKRTSSAEHKDKLIDMIVSYLQEETKDQLSGRSFNSVVRKVMSKYNQGKITKGKFRDYLVTALDNKINDLELRRQKEDAKKAAMESREKQPVISREPIEFYDWLSK